MTAVLDAGALVGVDKRDRQVGALLRVFQREGVQVLTSAGVVAQVWRDGRRQANLARVLAGTDVLQLDEATARKVGEVLKVNRSDDIVDAHIALMTGPKDVVLTSDDIGIKALLRARRVRATVVHV